MKNKTFTEKVYELIKNIPSGKVSTYKLIAKELNSNAYRAVGQACRRNPRAPKIPCHRVVSSSGKLLNYSAEGGIKRSIELLRKEGIVVKNKRIENFKKVLYKFQ